MKLRTLFLAAVFSIGVAGISSATTVTFGGQINPLYEPNVIPPVYNLQKAVIAPNDIFGGWNPYGPTDTSHSWLDISKNGSAWTKANNNLSIIWGSPSSSNTINFFSNSKLVYSIDTEYLIDHFNVINSTAPGYLLTFAGNFDTVEFLEKNGNFEIGFVSASVPEISVWLMLFIGFYSLYKATTIKRNSAIWL